MPTIIRRPAFYFGNPEFFRYNVAATFNPLRIPIALLMRLWQLFGYFGLYLLTFAGLLAMFRPPQTSTEAVDDRARANSILDAGSISRSVLAYLIFMS